MDQLNINEIMDYQFSISVVYIDTKGIEDVAECVLTYEHSFKTVYLCGNQKSKTYEHSFKTVYLCGNQKSKTLGFPGGAVVENLPANAVDTGSSPGLGRSHMPRSN